MFGAFLTSLIRTDPKSLFDLLAVRRSLEIQSVTLAARQASRSGLAAVEAALADMWNGASSVDGGTAGAEADFRRADARFHSALALAGGNRVLTYLFEAMEASLMEAFAAGYRGRVVTRQRFLDSCAAHAEVLRQVGLRDTKGAVEAMNAILDQAEFDLRQGVGKG